MQCAPRQGPNMPGMLKASACRACSRTATACNHHAPRRSDQKLHCTVRIIMRHDAIETSCLCVELQINDKQKDHSAQGSAQAVLFYARLPKTIEQHHSRRLTQCSLTQAFLQHSSSCNHNATLRALWATVKPLPGNAMYIHICWSASRNVRKNQPAPNCGTSKLLKPTQSMPRSIQRVCSNKDVLQHRDLLGGSCCPGWGLIPDKHKTTQTLLLTMPLSEYFFGLSQSPMSANKLMS